MISRSAPQQFRRDAVSILCTCFVLALITACSGYRITAQMHDPVDTNESFDSFNSASSRDSFKSFHPDVSEQEESEEDASESKTQEPNVDRISCLRQDNLDLVIPGKAGDDASVVRMVVPINKNNTGRDVYVSIEAIQVKELSAVVQFRRVGTASFAFEVYGGKSVDGNEEVANADLFLSGLEVHTSSTAIDWATSLVTDRKQLKQGQKAQLYFKLSGEVVAVWDEELGEWILKLSKEKADPFKFKMTNQMLVETALTSFGGIDKVLLEKVLFPIVKAAIPISSVASLQFVSQSDLNVEIWSQVFGSMKEPNGPLELRTKLSAKVGVEPGRVLDVFMKNFNITELAIARVDRFLKRDDLREMMIWNRPLFIKTLQQYGFAQTGQDLLKMVESARDIEDLRPRLLKVVSDSADGLTKGLQPFITAHEKGAQNIFDGVSIGGLAQVHWDVSGEDGGSVFGSLQAPGAGQTPQGWSEFVALPANFLNVVLPAEMSTSSGNHTGEITLRGLVFNEATLQLVNLAIKNLFVKMPPSPNASGQAEAAVAQIWNLEGEAGDFVVRLPKSMDPGLSLSLQDLRFTSSQEGVAAALGSRGLIFRLGPHVIAGSAAGSGNLRSGPAEALDGALPADYIRPTQPGPNTSLPSVAPMLKVQADVQVAGKKDRLTISLSADATAKIDIASAVRSALGSRPLEDFGYVFASEKLERRIKNGESQLPETSDTFAVVSCGYLRLLNISRDLVQGDVEPSVKRLSMEPKKGQLQLDLTQYMGQPQVVNEDGSTACLVLYSGGYEPRKAGGWLSIGSKEVDERLCGPRDKVQRLARAIGLQISRFADARAEDWNFGTHSANSSQFVLPSGELPKNLTLAVAGESSSLFEATAAVDESASVFEATAAKAQGDSAEFSQMRKACRAQDNLDRKYYIPEEHGQKAVRMAIAALPGIGDLYVVLDAIHVTLIDFHVRLWRKKDKTIGLTVMGNLMAYIEGLDFTTPSSAVDDLAKFAAGTEKVVATIFTLGLKRNNGRLDRGPVDISVNMSGDFQTNRTGQWEAVEGTTHQKANVSFGVGGLLHGLINMGIEKAGGMDQIFFDSIWPIVMSIIPENLGAAFERVPYSAAELVYDFQIKGVCRDAKQRTCPSEELDLEVRAKTDTRCHPEPIVQALLQGGRVESEAARLMMGNLLKAFSQKESIFAGADLAGDVQVELSSNQNLSVATSTQAVLPMGLLTSLVGAESSMLNFIPNQGPLSASGSVELKGGELSVPAVRVSNVRLPVVLADGQDSVELSLTLGPIRVKNVAALEEELVFGEFSPLAVRAPEYAIGIDRAKGLTAAFHQGGTGGGISINVAPGFVRNMLFMATARTTTPVNVRTGPADAPDGAVPERFMRPFSRWPASLNLSHILKHVQVGVGFRSTGAKEEEILSPSFEIALNTTLRLDRSLFRGILDSKDADHGYLHYHMAAFYGELTDKGTGAPKRKVFVNMACGSVDIFDADDKPYSKLLTSVDIYDAIAPNHFFEIKEMHCLHMPATKGIFKDTENHLCGDAKQIDALREGWVIQRDRFSKVHVSMARAANEFVMARESRATSAATAKLNRTAAAIEAVKRAAHDGTWFKVFNPYDLTTVYPGRMPPKLQEEVSSPLSQWEATLQDVN